VTGTEKRCTVCGETQPIELFGVGRGRDGRTSECHPCRRKRRLRYENPDGVTAANIDIGRAPDRQPAVRLREDLERRRAAGEKFSKALPPAIDFAVKGLDPEDEQEWRLAFEWSQRWWLTGYRPELNSCQKPLPKPEDYAVAA
jgi:hypothetical protein